MKKIEKSNKKINVAILGATGNVGQKVISMLKNHPLFVVAELAASGNSVGKKYQEACQWRDDSPLDDKIANTKVIDCKKIKSTYAISALPSDVALDVEPFLAKNGHYIISNASTFRMDPKVPLLIPEINSNHIELMNLQSTKGKIITNPNCATVNLACALKVLQSVGDIDHVSVVTLQAVSGAGYPGVPSLDIIGNTIPFISNEEDKLETESLKILGEIKNNKIKPAQFKIDCHVNRVPVIDGHSVIMHIYFKQKIDLKKIEKTFKTNELFKFHELENRPQPRKDLLHNDMRVHIGRLKQGNTPNSLGLVSLAHNLTRGAAGAAILNLELLVKYLK